MKNQNLPVYNSFEFREDHTLENVSLEDLQKERLLKIKKEEDLEEFYYPLEKPLKFE